MTALGFIFAALLFAVIVLAVLGALVNSITKNVAQIAGVKNRSAFCKIKLKFANGTYATVCPKCGRQQPSDFDQILQKAGVTLEVGEHGKYTSSNVMRGGVKGQLVLTNKRLLFKVKGGDTKSWSLADMSEVLQFTDQPGFVIQVDGQRYDFRNTGKKSQWYEQVLAAANAPLVAQLRNQKQRPSSSPAQSAALPPGIARRLAQNRLPAVPQPTIAPAPPGTQAGWLTDPVGRYEQRYWDGSKWTEHVSSNGKQSTHFI